MRVAVLMCGLLGLGSAPAFADPKPPPSGQGAVDAILAEPLPDAAYGEPKECIDMRFSSSVRTEVLDSSHVLFFGMHNQVWLNQLRGECTGLTQGSLLVFGIQPATDTRLCHTDRFRNVDRYGWGPPAAMPCILGDFQPITQDQADRLRMLFRTRSSAPTIEQASKVGGKTSKTTSALSE